MAPHSLTADPSCRRETLSPQGGKMGMEKVEEACTAGGTSGQALLCQTSYHIRPLPPPRSSALHRRRRLRLQEQTQRFAHSRSLWNYLGL